MSDWRHQAACVGLDPELWFPVGVLGPALEQEAVAKAVCAGCPVRAVCLEWASQRCVQGVWGGLSELERRALELAA
jgi:WhiB family transcriptional regulator, redox-sensing transcriptional regulator